MNARTILVALTLATLAALAGCATGGDGPPTTLPPAATEVVPADVAAGGDPPAEAPAATFGTTKLGEQVEIRPGLFIVVTAQALTLPVGQTGAVAPHVRVVVTYDNRTDKPMQGMGTITAIGGVADLSGNTFALAGPQYDPKTYKPTVDTHQVGNVFPGHTGTVAELFAPTAAWETGQEVQVTVHRPALLGEEQTSIFGGPGDVMAVGVPTVK